MLNHNKEIAALFAAFKSDNIDPTHFTKCINSIHEMTLPKYLTAVYVDCVYPIAVYLDWINNFLTVERFAEYYEIPVTVAHSWIAIGSNLHEDHAAYCKGAK